MTSATALPDPQLLAVRKLFEMAYCFAWGVDGNADLRDEFRLCRETLVQVGKMSYDGQRFTWEKFDGALMERAENICDNFERIIVIFLDLANPPGAP